MQEEQMLVTTPHASRDELFVMTPQGELLCWMLTEGDADVGPTVVPQAEVDDELVTELRTLAGLLAEMHPRVGVISGSAHGHDSDNDRADGR
jgi:hypothetical protein